MVINMSIVEHEWHSKDEMPLPDIKVIQIQNSLLM